MDRQIDRQTRVNGRKQTDGMYAVKRVHCSVTSSAKRRGITGDALRKGSMSKAVDVEVQKVQSCH